MPIKVTLTKDPAHIDAILKVRHQVFSEEGDYFTPTENGRILDRFDAYPTTHNLVVLSDDKVVGGMRLTKDSAAGLPADEFYDFRSHVPANSKLLNAGMYCVTKPHRSSRIALGLILMASYFGLSENVSHVIAPVNPTIAKLLGRVGFKALDKEITEPSGLVILPMLLDVRELGDFFAKFVENNQLHNFIHSYECFFYRKGEYILRRGEQAESAFVIVDGQVDILSPTSNEVLATLKEGEVFGELALLTDDVRSADIVANTDVRVMSLPRKEFLAHLLNNPENSMQMLKNIGERLKGMLSTQV